jgi:hypothetical protein
LTGVDLGGFHGEIQTAGRSGRTLLLGTGA